jgi:hypothetical protein
MILHDLFHKDVKNKELRAELAKLAVSAELKAAASTLPDTISV